ncbi:Uncharacterized protein dnl_01490 [Desulfonema limicola]|uniref:STAS domain-containing protein n=1 Tax=Desulfonema limicola TaxID=45656 RepID=A0A975B379_9BACT|nr:hypothetical protein [Desulfonema limicola]QTA77946.1 Uncharacterized protein dnl_01490 [Desulfonema limicola]
MIVKSKTGISNIILGLECTIAETEKDFEKIKEISEISKGIDLDINQVQEIDTAYFQMLLSLKAWTEHKKIPFSISGTSNPINEISKLYGVEL